MFCSPVRHKTSTTPTRQHARSYSLLHFALLTLMFCNHHHVCAETIFNNFGERLEGAHPLNLSVTAQPFLLGNHDTLNSVTLGIGGKGNPNGDIHVEIWDDSGSGMPGEFRGTMGAITPILDMSLNRESESIVFDSPVSGLEPNEPYYIVVSTDGTNWNNSNDVRWGATKVTGAAGAGEGMATLSTGEWHTIRDQPFPPGPPFPVYFFASIDAVASLPGNQDRILRAGDADQDLDFDQLDLVQVQVAAKYLTGDPATWGEGDWNGAPGGSPGAPPPGDGVFNQFDIIAAQQGAIYLTGPYAAVQSNGTPGDSQTSVVYNAGTGELAVDAPAGVELTSINIDSAAGIFTGEAATNLGGSFDNDADANIFKATFGGSFGSLSFGNVAPSGLSEEFVSGDLTVVGSLAGGGDLGNVDLVYVPEPTSILLLTVGTLIGLLHFMRANR